MALTTAWKGQLKISLVSFPVRLYAAVGSTNKLALNQLHKQCYSRIQLDTFCPKHGKLTRSEITKGYEYEKHTATIAGSQKTIAPPTKIGPEDAKKADNFANIQQNTSI